MTKLTLTLMPEHFTVCRMKPQESIPNWAVADSFFSITKTADEFSIVSVKKNIPDSIKSEKDWRAFKIEGPFDFALSGILSSILSPLAHAAIGIFAISTFDTDYVLIKNENIEKAISILQKDFEVNF